MREFDHTRKAGWLQAYWAISRRAQQEDLDAWRRKIAAAKKAEVVPIAGFQRQDSIKKRA